MTARPRGSDHTTAKKIVGTPVSPRYMRDRWDRFLSQDADGMMLVEGVRVDEIAKRYGTPLLVMVESEIRRNCRRFQKVFGPDIGLQFAVKCSSNLEILRIVREEGFELDCSSVGEIILGLLADFKPRQITLTNLFKSEQDLHFAAKVDIQSITADSIEEIEHIAATAKKLKKHIRTVIRVNPMLTVGSYTTRGNKYGIPIGYVDRAVDLAVSSPYVDFRGFHFMGGYVYQPRVFKAAARTFVKLIRRCEQRGIRIRTLSLGGGFPAAIGDQTAFPIEKMKDFPDYFNRLLERHGMRYPVKLLFEPGKSIVMNAGIGLMRVIARKRLGRNKRMVNVDGSTYNFMPDALIQTDITYDLLPASKLKSPRIHTVTIGGNTCDCWDLLIKDINMPKLRAGDLVTAMDAGAYTYVMASNFNTNKRAPIVLISEDGSTRLIRRRGRFSEMFAPELDVLKMAGPNELEVYNNLYRVNVDEIWRGGGMTKAWKKKEKEKATMIAHGASGLSAGVRAAKEAETAAEI